eukprot:1543459-Prymnesium_polylepis.1
MRRRARRRAPLRLRLSRLSSRLAGRGALSAFALPTPGQRTAHVGHVCGVSRLNDVAFHYPRWTIARLGQ